MRIIAALATLTGFGLFLAACNKVPDQPVAVHSAEASAEATDAVLVEEPSMAATDATVESNVLSDLDVQALHERNDPERLLRFYVAAVKAGDWQNATKAWSLDAQMTPAKLEAGLNRFANPRMAVGKGDTKTAVGTVFYEVPVVIDFGQSRPSMRGTIVLRRVNEVAGVSEDQLHWRIQRISILKP